MATELNIEAKINKFLFKDMESPPLLIQKNDSKYLTKLQIKKAQFLFENDYFIWNEAEMYLRVTQFNQTNF